jgi:replicative DNA helicase
MLIEPKKNEEYEKQILGALLSDANCHKSRECLDLLSPDDFYFSTYRNMFSEIKLMSEAKQEINPITVETWMEKKGVDCVGFYFLAELQRNFISKNAIDGYIAELKSCSTSRKIIQLNQNSTSMIQDNYDPEEIIGFIDTSLKGITSNDSGRTLDHIKYATGGWLDNLERREQAGGGILGVSTGLPQLDEALGGFDEESLIVVAGAPSMGKTLFTQLLTTNVGVDQKLNTMFFSMEMSANQLYERFISGIGNIPPRALKLARFDKETNGRISNAVQILEASGVYYTDEQGLSVNQIRAKVRRHKTKKPDLKMIVIDYLGLIKLEKADRHDIAIGNVTRALKELAKEVKATIVLVAQANRTTTRPNMRSLKDSSCIEADADVIMFVHRHEILEPETELKGITELIIAKDRHNDGNGTIYMEKINGGFRELTTEQAAMMTHREQERLNTAGKKNIGWNK